MRQYESVVSYTIGNGWRCIWDRLFIEKKKVAGQFKGRENQFVSKYDFCWSLHFLSVLGLLWGITGGSPETAFGEVLSDATLMMGNTYFIVAFAAVIASFILRKRGKMKASIWINVIAFAYIVFVLAINSLVGEIL